MDTLVVAFGGNAISRAGQSGTYAEQLTNVRAMSDGLVRLASGHHRVLITHGNGPQVGQIALQQDISRSAVPAMPLDVAGAMSEGQIGYMLQQALHNSLHRAGDRQTCVAVITQVVVAPHDPAFRNPTKPVGAFYTAERAEHLRREKGWHMVEDAGRGYRRVVASPRPVDIVEWPAIRALVDAHVLTIAAGGGGVPVVRDAAGHLSGVEAVIDKDRAAERLASLICADTLVLLTDVDHVAVRYGTPEQRMLKRMQVDEMRGLVEQGEFPPGSMGPKVEAALAFIDSGGKRAIITSIANMVQAVLHGGGTEVMGECASAVNRAGPIEQGARRG